MNTYIRTGLMEMVYDDAQNILSVKWSDELSVESAQFFQTIVALFATIQEKQVSKLLVDSGIPAGGLLTEEIIEFFIKNIPDTPLKRIVLLESPDYLWDNNLYQVILLLVTNYQLPIEVKLAKTHADGLGWLTRPISAETQNAL